MRLTIANTFDDKTGELKGSQYFVNGRIVSEDEYCSILEETAIYDEPECDGICEECEYNDCEEDEDPCDCLECTIERYVELIQSTNGCPSCIEEILYDLLDEVIEDED